MRIKWTIEKIRDGFERFKNEHGRLPKATEIDVLAYLPSSRFIQAQFGGLEKLRAQLGYAQSHFGKGAFRSEIASRINVRGRDVERALEVVLRDTFGEVFVHTEKMFDQSKNRVDFYIYSLSGNFGIDIFYPDTMRTLQSSVNIKMHKYRNFKEELYFASANESILQNDLDSFARSKTKPLPKRTKMVTLDNLFNLLKTKKSYPNPLAY